MVQNYGIPIGSSGAMDNASAYGAEDCRFDPCLDRYFLIICNFLKL